MTESNAEIDKRNVLHEVALGSSLLLSETAGAYCPVELRSYEEEDEVQNTINKTFDGVGVSHRFCEGLGAVSQDDTAVPEVEN